MMPAVIILLMVAMYFFMIRPQNKRRKEVMEKQRQAGPGQTIVTIGGLHATIIDSDDATVTLEVSPGVMCVYERGAIARVVEDTDTTDSSDSDATETDAVEDTPASAVVDMKADKSSSDDSRK